MRIQPVTRTIAVALGLALAAVIGSPARPALAFPPLPSSFYGVAQINGENVPDGTRVVAMIDGVAYGETRTQTYQGRSVYGIDIAGDDAETSAREGGRDGDTIQFWVGGVLMSQTGVWRSGTNVLLDLSSTSVTPPATPEPTASPTLSPPATPTPQPAPVVHVAQPTVTPATLDSSGSVPPQPTPQPTLAPAAQETPAPAPTPAQTPTGAVATVAPTQEQAGQVEPQPDATATPIPQPTQSSLDTNPASPTPTVEAPPPAEGAAPVPTTVGQAVSQAAPSPEPSATAGDAAPAIASASPPAPTASQPAGELTSADNTGVMVGVAIMAATVAVIGWVVFRRR
jgi:hypothetical protein